MVEANINLQMQKIKKKEELESGSLMGHDVIEWCKLDDKVQKK